MNCNLYIVSYIAFDGDTNDACYHEDIGIRHEPISRGIALFIFPLAVQVLRERLTIRGRMNRWYLRKSISLMIQ
jgi:hypothetical protein